MSANWDVFCLDCNEKAGIEDANNLEQDLLALCKHASTLAKMKALRNDMDICSLSVQIGGGISYVPLDFFAKHNGHRLIPRNEYGRCLDECGEDIPCACCGNQCAKRCRLPPLHTGEHSPERP